ncbi:MAG: aminomethyl-transferring glycine dehydrogenase subunit GcvPA [candidate division WOR-3 bacterium]|nr:MAG: aminomethyl-transferring glycine dehydrogenase subunit GcvPA [candidate division WOR-3 bacterium]
MKYTPHTDADRALMLERIGVKSVEDLFSGIPADIRVKGRLNLPEPLSEMEVLAELGRIAASNRSPVCFAGAGAYDHFSPAIVDTIVSRPEFYTAYTPYQAEVSQGTLQAIYEFQSLVCRLFDMDVANASMYDCASALAETTHLARDQTSRAKVLVSEGVHPHHIEVVRTYAHGLNIPLKPVPLDRDVTDVTELRRMLSDDVAAVIVQHPNFLGSIEPMAEISAAAHQADALLTVSVDPISLGVLAPPGAYDADIAVADGQSLGIPLSYGGPYLGLFAAKKRFIRRMPGRISAKTVDVDGNTGYVLALQTREQHIRRERATSNICTNQALVALAASVYLSVMGKEGIKAVACHCLAKARYLADRIAALPGFGIANQALFFKEFTVSTPVPARDIVAKGIEQDLLPGVDLGMFDNKWQNRLLVAVTEKRTKAEMDRLAEFLGGFGSQ